MKKTLVHNAFAALLLAAASATGFAAAPSIPSPPTVPTTGYILIDHDSGRVLAEQRSDDRMEPASITKLMTAYLVFTALKEKTPHARRDREGQRIRLAQGRRGHRRLDQLPRAGLAGAGEDLIQGMIVQSGNDATITLAEKLGGTEDASCR